MNRNTLLFVAPAVLGLWAGCSGGFEADEGNLVGGRQASASDFPSTLIVRGNCTVSKVGPRHILTAAHCVDDHTADDGVEWRFKPGRRIDVSQAKDTGDGQFVSVEIERTAIHPVWVQLSRRDNGNVLIDEHPPDVAVIILTEDSADAIADVPVASVDLSPVANGERLWIMGYGCENGVDNQNRYPEGSPRLKIQATEALPQTVLEHAGTFIPTRQNPIVHERYVITPGKAMKDSEASLCPGDSGGPVYREGAGQNVVVGVNAYYSFLPRFEDPDRVSYTNWHTRLDEISPWEVNPWLRDLGVSTVETGAGGGQGGGGQGGGGGFTPGGDDCAIVVINEVSPHGLTSGTDEFVELYNAGTCGVSLDGFKLMYSPKNGNFEQLYWTGGPSDGIAPGSYYTIGGEDFPGLSWGYGVLAQGIAKRGGGLAVLDPAGRVVDSMAYGEVRNSHPFIEGTPVGNFEDRIGYNKSAARVPDGTDTDDNEADFAFDVQRTPGAANQN